MARPSLDAAGLGGAAVEAALDLSYATLQTADGIVGNASGGAGNYWFSVDSLSASGTATTGASVDGVIRIAPTEFVVAGEAALLNLAAVLATNPTAPGITITAGLYPITSVGAANTLAINLGTVVPGSTVAFVTQAPNTVGVASSGDFAVTAAGPYALGVALSGTAAVNSWSAINLQLRTRLS